MHIAVIGAGGVGGYFGARLAAAGERVTFVQRGAHLEAMRAGGLRVSSPLGDVTLDSVDVRADTADVGAVDVVLICVKSAHTEAAGAAAKAMLGAETAVISLQNGVENEARLAAIVGGGHVLGGTVYLLSLIEAPGHIRHSTPGARLIFGERDGRRTPRAQAFLGACEGAGIDVELTADIEAALWTKFTGLCAHNGMTALTRCAIGPIRDDPDCRAILQRCADEVLALAAARGVTLAESFRAAPLSVFLKVPGTMTSSMHHDITHARPLEVEWLNGAVVRLAAEVGLDVPVNATIHAGLKLHAAGETGESA